MADNAWNADDFSALWGDQEDSRLTPTRPQASPSETGPERGDVWTPPNGGGDRSHLTLVDQEVRDGVERLARSIAVNRVDLVRQTDPEALRTDVDGTVTHQLAVALYEVLVASNDRFTAAEDHMVRRLNDAMEAHSIRLTTAMEECRVLPAESAEAMRSGMAAIHSNLNGPIEALAAFQRDMRHEVGRLGDIVAGEAAALARKAEADAGALDSSRRHLADRFERIDTRADEADAQRSGVSEILGTVKDDVSALREEIAELRQTLGSGGRRVRKAQWWRRSG